MIVNYVLSVDEIEQATTDILGRRKEKISLSETNQMYKSLTYNYRETSHQFQPNTVFILPLKLYVGPTECT